MRVKSDAKSEDVQVQMESCGALLCTEKERCQGGQCTRAARLLEREGATAVWLHTRGLQVVGNSGATSCGTHCQDGDLQVIETPSEGLIRDITDHVRLAVT